MPRIVLILVGILGLSALVGCTSLGAGRSEGGGQAQALSLDERLSTIAACHLLRVGQWNDVAVTDAVVIVAADKYKIPIESIIERSNQLAQDYQSRPSDLVSRAVAACQQLETMTGEVSALVRFEPNGSLRTAWLRIDGLEIAPGFAKRTAAELRRRKAIGLVINSPGGSVYEARTLGRYLRANGLRTAVDGYCASACVDVLAGGVERYVTAEAKLGIHQSKVPRRYSTHEGGQLYVADSFLYLREMGVDADVAIAAASVPNDKILLIPIADALATGLVTGVVDGFE
ncbi:hypothetical protein G3480_04380 [Thiorhodococcus mannitoliphagus]|uniref:Periplasmic protein-like protein n=1 Tax=Thiorhodococcus mannitoliphagus TaxID=329406 RepID=A0A6P1DMR9_9GAMM|nr:ATP-dependent Clp protease proteolytic subunit [Thiorhodococcus mannitoliphagus]NEX19557.1 hypothetical protein [Thiorhodococcus mannitoliphagus]